MLLRKKLRFGFDFTSRYRGEALGLDCSKQNLRRDGSNKSQIRKLKNDTGSRRAERTRVAKQVPQKQRFRAPKTSFKTAATGG